MHHQPCSVLCMDLQNAHPLIKLIIPLQQWQAPIFGTSRPGHLSNWYLGILPDSWILLQKNWCYILSDWVYWSIIVSSASNILDLHERLSKRFTFSFQVGWKRWLLFFHFSFFFFLLLYSGQACKRLSISSFVVQIMPVIEVSHFTQAFP